jgi:peptidoglycan/LPS O-acetylase OafA/YrhL
MFRSILAILAGYVAMTVVTLLSVLVLAWAFGHPLDPKAPPAVPSTRYMLCNLAVSFAGAILGGFVAARLGSRSPLRHALALGAVVLVLGAAYAVRGWGGVQPEWYLMVLPLAGAGGSAVGGSLARRRFCG